MTRRVPIYQPTGSRPNRWQHDPRGLHLPSGGGQGRRTVLSMAASIVAKSGEIKHVGFGCFGYGGKPIRLAIKSHISSHEILV